MNNPVLTKPLITEKSVQDAKSGKFSFVVAKTASKIDIKKAVEKKFSVNVVDIATSIVKGRTKRSGTRRTEIQLPVYKKAVVSLKEGQKIDMFDVQE